MFTCNNCIPAIIKPCACPFYRSRIFSNTSEQAFPPTLNQREAQIHLWMQLYTSHSETLYKKILWGLESSHSADHWPLTAQQELANCLQGNKVVAEWWFSLSFSCCYSWHTDACMGRQSTRSIKQLEIKNSSSDCPLTGGEEETEVRDTRIWKLFGRAKEKEKATRWCKNEPW